MTTKEIAQASGKSERRVQQWAKLASAKIASINAKIASASPAHPADYNVEETLAIIEHGMGVNAAAIFRANAERSQTFPVQSIENTDMPSAFRMMASAFDRLVKITESQETRLQRLETKVETQKQLPQIEQDYFTIRAYAARAGLHLTTSEAAAIGRLAVAESRRAGREILKADDERFGFVNSYHLDVLREVFTA